MTEFGEQFFWINTCIILFQVRRHQGMALVRHQLWTQPQLHLPAQADDVWEARAAAQLDSDSQEIRCRV